MTKNSSGFRGASGLALVRVWGLRDNRASLLGYSQCLPSIYLSLWPLCLSPPDSVYPRLSLSLSVSVSVQVPASVYERVYDWCDCHPPPCSQSTF